MLAYLYYERNVLKLPHFLFQYRRIGSISAHSSPRPEHKTMTTSIPSSSSATTSSVRSPQVARKQVGGEPNCETRTENTEEAALWRPATSSAASNIPKTSSALAAVRQK